MNDSEVDLIINKYHRDAGSLIQILLEVQKEHQWLPKEVLEKISRELDVPLSRIQHIATFYKAFSVVPKGRHEVHVCMGTACHVRGAERVLDRVQDQLGIRPGETDTDLKFGLEIVNCLGCCALGPVMTVDKETHGKLAPAKVKDVLGQYD